MQAKHSWTFFEWSTEWNLESNHDSLRKPLLLSQNPSKLDVWRSTNGQQGLWTPWPNLRRRADLKKIWACNFPLFHPECFFVRELMKSDPSNLGGWLWGQQQHQDTRLNNSVQCFHRQAHLWLTQERQWRQRLEYQQNFQSANQLQALDQQMEIDMQQEKVTDNKWRNVLQHAIGLLDPSQRYSRIEEEKVCQLWPEKKKAVTVREGKSRCCSFTKKEIMRLKKGLQMKYHGACY